MTEHTINLPAQLHPSTRELLKDFIEALGEKLREAEKHYKYTNEWENSLWKVECQKAIKEHMEKGDPLDVAAYCAFMWHHDWPTK